MRSRLTPYGQKCREFRSRYNLVMADQARGLGVSVAYISAIELGKRSIPLGYTVELSHWMSLPQPDADLLDSLEIGSKRTVEISPQTAEQATLAFELSESLGDLPREGVEYLRSCLAAARSAKNPYSEIRRRALVASAVFNLDVRSTFDVLKIVENKLFLIDKDFSVQVEQDRAGQSPIYSDSDGTKVDRFVCSQWFYNEAGQQTAASRFKLAHEIAHWILHPHNSHAYSRNPSSGRIVSKYVSIEQEADEFAIEFLMPLEVVERFPSAEALAKSANVPLGVAKRRFAFVKSLTASERDQIRSLVRAIAQRIRPTRSPAASQVLGLADATHKFSRHKKRTKPLGPTLTLFEYADLKEGVGTRADHWFRDFGYRG